MNRSPWLHQLERQRPLHRLDQHRHEDVVVIGGGIAGMMTAAFTLLNTTRSVLLLEAGHVAHGATGHNAGQITSYFERPFPDMVREYGLEASADAQRAIESGWDLLEQVRLALELRTPIHRFMGFAGLPSKETLEAFLITNRLRMQAGLHPYPIYISEENHRELHLRAEDQPYTTLLPRQQLRELLETPNDTFIAVSTEQKGVTNSAVLTEEIAGTLLARFPDRFCILEETPVKDIVLGRDTHVITGDTHTIHARSIVLCTNGFESFTLRTEQGVDIDSRFHASIHPLVAYMAGYEAPAANPIALSYLEQPYGGDLPYAYMTRRPLSEHTSLICWGEPESALEHHRLYKREPSVPEPMISLLHKAIRRLRPKDTKRPFRFTWHGLMGYTPSRIRIIGKDPCHPELLYNLGCNGIGILPSIYGGKRISQLLNGEQLPRSIFDPKDTRCKLPSARATTRRTQQQRGAQSRTT